MKKIHHAEGGCRLSYCQAGGARRRNQAPDRSYVLLLNIPAQSLEAVGKLDEIESVNADGANRLTNSNARVKSKVSEVATREKAAAHNLPQAYTGKGVVVGIIDQGIDFNHAAFRNADGT